MWSRSFEKCTKYVCLTSDNATFDVCKKYVIICGQYLLNITSKLYVTSYTASVSFCQLKMVSFAGQILNSVAFAYSQPA
jgi:hypothetical protein